MSEKKKTDLEQLLKQNKQLAQDALGKDHLKFDALYALAQNTLIGEKRIHAEAHLAVCQACSETLSEFKEAAEFSESYKPKPAPEEMPETVRNAIPKVKAQPLTILASLSFSKDRILQKVKGLVDDLDNFIIQTIESDTEFVANTRNQKKQTADYKINYQDMELVISTNIEQEIVEIYANVSDPKQQEQLNIELVDTAIDSPIKANRFVIGEFVRFIFSEIDLDNTSYELRITANPPAE